MYIHTYLKGQPLLSPGRLPGEGLESPPSVCARPVELVVVVIIISKLLLSSLLLFVAVVVVVE